ncbi:MAG: TrmH family RNA methyltransferase [Bacteroidota bacterium]
MNQANQFFKNQSYKPLSKEAAPIIIAWHLKTPENAGHLLRLAANVGCRLVLFVKDEDEVSFKDTKMKYVAGQSAKEVDWSYCLPRDVEELVPSGYTFVALETSAGSSNLFDAELPEKMALMVGSEKSGIPWGMHFPGQLDVHIPMLGPVKSMNVSHAAVVCLFEWVRLYGLWLKSM